MSEIPQLPAKAVRWTIIGIVFFLLILIYGQSLHNEFVRWDDGMLIYENPMIRSINFSTLKQIFTTYDPELYIPLTFFTYQIDYFLGGANASMYHVTNLLLHGINALLVMWFLLLLTKRKSVALFVGFLFAVHPLHTEAVAWASARKDVLATVFFLLTLILYLRQNKWSLFTFLLGLLAKVTVVPLPVVLILMDWWQERKITRASLREKIPYFILSIIFGIVALFGKTGAGGLSHPLELTLVSAKGTIFYLQKLFVPVGLSVLYPYTDPITITSDDFFIPLLLLTLLTLFTLFSLKRTRTLAFALAFFILTLAPSLPNYAKAGTIYIASDRYAYIPSIGIFLLVGMFFAWLCRRGGDLRALIANGGAIVIIIVLSVLSYRQSLLWRDTFSLFNNVLAHYDNSYVAYNNVGNAYRYRKQLPEAIASYQKARDIYSMLPRTLDRDPEERDPALARILCNFGSGARENNDLANAKLLYEQALEADPLSVQAHAGLGIVHQLLRNLVSAELFFREALRLQPTFTTARINLGAVFVHQGKIEEAIAEYNKAIESNPFYPQAYYNLGVALRKLERNREAKEAYEKAVELEPSFVAARINLGILYAERKQTDDAIAQFEAALQYDPDNRRAMQALQQLRAQH